jgi:Holliday junction resolvase RusA-like endonuclease
LPIQIFELHRHGYKDSRADLDNLIKELAEACEDSGLVKDDAQIAFVEAKKLK